MSPIENIEEPAHAPLTPVKVVETSFTGGSAYAAFAA